MATIQLTGIAVTNTTPATVTAFALEWSPPVAAGSRVSKVIMTKFYDAATEPLAAKPIPPHGSVTLPYAAGAESAPQVPAVLFATGASWGDAVWIGRITNRRAYMQQSLVAVLADLTAAAASVTTTRQSLITQFQSAQTAEQVSSADGDQRACIHTVRGIVLMNLQGPVPLKDVIAHEIGALQARLTAVQANAVGQ